MGHLGRGGEGSEGVRAREGEAWAESGPAEGVSFSLFFFFLFLFSIFYFYFFYLLSF
jgi:hypothetical protein